MREGVSTRRMDHTDKVDPSPLGQNLACLKIFERSAELLQPFF